MIANAGKMNAPNAPQACVECPGANRRLRGEKLESALKVFGKGTWCSGTIRFPPVRRLPDLTRGGPSDFDSEWFGQAGRRRDARTSSPLTTAP